MKTSIQYKLLYALFRTIGVNHAITVFYRNDQSGSQRQFEKLVWKEEDMPDFGLLGFSVMSEMDTIV